jgi:hypothetical protein
MADEQERQPRRDGNQTAILGEYLVVAKLTKLGFNASLTLKNTKSIDILVSNKDATKMACIQVKTDQQNRSLWNLSKKNEELISNNLFYVFVRLHKDEGKDKAKETEYYVVPSADVAKHIIKNHEEFLAGGGVDNNFRSFDIKDIKEAYKDKWELLDLGYVIEEDKMEVYGSI